MNMKENKTNKMTVEQVEKQIAEKDIFSPAEKGEKNIIFFNKRREDIDVWIETGHIENRWEDSENSVKIGEISSLCRNEDCNKNCKFNPHVRMMIDMEEKESIECASKINKEAIIKNINHLNENNDDELLKKRAYVESSKYRTKTIKVLKGRVLMPKTIARETGIRQNHISKVLSELKEKELVECINEEARKGRIYRLTKIGEEI